ncbi:MAG: SLC13 family permease, partial [Phycisphaerales bacterium]|nr:SLC13 family permease [Phycisphaerales bacterium]
MLIVVAILLLLVIAVIFTRAPLDVAMVGCLLLLVLTGQVSPESAFLGFSNTAVLMIGALFVVASGLRQTGAIDRIAPALIGRPMNVRSTIGRVSLPVTALSGFMNTTPLVAMFLPVSLDISRRLKVSPSRVLMPLSFAGILGGQLTLVGTASNIVVDGLYGEQIATWTAAGMEVDSSWILDGPARFFAVGVSGIVAAIVGLLFLVIVGPLLLPDRGRDVSNEDTDRYEVRVEVQSGGPIAGKTIEQAGLRHLPDLFLAAVERSNKRLAAISPDESLQPGDILCFVGSTSGVGELRGIAGIEPEDAQSTKIDAPAAIRTMVEAVVAPTASFVGRTVRESQFRTIYNAAILAVHRRGTRIEGRIGDISLRAGDVLLLETHQGFLTSHGRGNAFYLATSVDNARFPRHERAPIAIAILLGMIACLATGLLTPVVATWLAALAMVGTRCINASMARKSIDFSVLITIGAAIGIGMAVAESGLGATVGQGLVDLVRTLGGGDRLLLATIVIAASLIAQFATNFGSAVIMFPVAISTALATGANPLPFVLGVMAGAGSNFLTPFGYQTNLMVFGPGRYRFLDFPRLGLPLLLIVIASATIMIPVVFPF